MPAPHLTLLLDADLYAPASRGRCSILVAGERIVWVGAKLPALPNELGVETFDLRGRRVIPGLIDGHTHLTGGGGEGGFKNRVPPVPLSKFTKAGITTVVGVLGTDDVTRGTAGLVASVRALREEGLSAWCMTGGYHLPPATLTGTVRGDIVSVDAIVGCGEVALSDHRSSQPTLEDVLRLASDCHVGGLLAKKAGTLHLHLGDGSRGLELLAQAIRGSELPARVFHPTHLNRRKELLREAFELAGQFADEARRGVAGREWHLDLTAFPVTPGDGASSADAALLEYLDAGLPPDRITISSDSGGSLPEFDGNGCCVGMGVGDPGSLAACLAKLSAQGQPLERVLPAFTSNWANLLRLANKGYIDAGRDADLCVLDEQGRVTDVMARGMWHVRDGRARVLGTFERAEA
ncbi:MAG: beta-aspartyl-peptidase [Planctomycetes bacterium]|nr:beta-aspartyl-peptidase [Planctomycetota bacterium]